MKEAFKSVLLNVFECFIMLFDISSIILFCFEYLRIKCPNNLKEQLFSYIKEHNLNENDYNLSYVFPGWSEKTDFNHTLLSITILSIGLIYIIFVIICYMLVMVSSYSKEKIFLIIICIILFIPQILISLLSLYFTFFYKNKLPEKTFEDFGELVEEIREA